MHKPFSDFYLKSNIPHTITTKRKFYSHVLKMRL